MMTLYNGHGEGRFASSATLQGRKPVGYSVVGAHNKLNLITTQLLSYVYNI